ncbi:MAG: hypothetical protein ABH836_07320 [Candidatus Omnitrophota bacterium]
MVEPWFAVFLTSIVPGAGHWYAGYKLRGVLFAIIAYLVIGAISIVALFLLHYHQSASPGKTILFSTCCIFIILGMWLFLLRNTYLTSRGRNLKQQVGMKSVDCKNAWFYAFFSRIIPGLGQILCGRIFRGLFLFIVYIVMTGFFAGLLLSVLRVMLLIIIVIDAFNCGQSIGPSTYNISIKLFLFITCGILGTNLIFPLSILKFVEWICGGI